MRLSPILLSLIIAVTLSGCKCYDEDVAWIEELYQPVKTTTSYNPKLIFDMPSDCRREQYISSEQFGRAPWPISPEALSYINDAEIISYRENFLSDQYLQGDHRPRDRYKRRIRGYRVGYMTR